MYIYIYIYVCIYTYMEPSMEFEYCDDHLVRSTPNIQMVKSVQPPIGKMGHPNICCPFSL